MDSESTFTTSEDLRRLIARNAPLWGGEAEVVRTYWDWPRRTRASDRQWVLRQLYKEYRDGILPLLAGIQDAVPNLERTVSRRELRGLTEVLHEEVEHYALFADLHDRLGDASAKTPDMDILEHLAAWPENDALRSVRDRHRRQYGTLGRRACQFTEGGCCTLFSEGMKLKGRGGDDDAIADVCARIHDDEFEHMLLAVVGLDEAGLTAADWDLLTKMTVEQLQQRIRMRNAQFGRPLPEPRIAELVAGKAEPLAFDYARAWQLGGVR